MDACFEVLEVVCMTEAACLEEALQTEVRRRRVRV